MTKHVERDKKSGILSYRRVYPIPLRPHIPRQPIELKRSLRSRSIADPRAAKIYADAQAEYERNVATARLKASGTSRSLAESDVAFLVGTYVHRLRENLNATHFDADDQRRDWLTASAWRYAPLGLMDDFTASQDGRDRAWTNSQRVREALPGLIRHWRTLKADGDRAGIIDSEGQTVEELALEFRLDLDPSSPVYFNLCLALLDADLATAGQLLRYVDPDDATPIEPVALPQREREAVSPAATPAQSPTITETMQKLAERLIQSPTSKISSGNQQSWRTSIRLWKDVHGDLGWQDITRSHVSEWLELLFQRPAKPHKRDDALPLPELIRRYSALTDAPRLTGRTVQKHATTLGAIWNKATRRGWIENKANPFTGHDIEVTYRAGGNRLTSQELETIFSLPVFTKGERPKRGRGEAAFWIPLFALCTGGRPGEIAQLLVSDFWEADGRWMMTFTDEGEHPASGPRRLKTSGHDTGRRTFPVPKTLIDLGLPRYLKWLKDSEETALFPKLTNSTKGLYRTWGDWWGLYVQEHKAIGEGKRQLREFRHTFPTQARVHGVSGEALTYLMGHANGTTTAGYGESDALGLEILKIKDFGTPLSHIPPWSPPAR